MSRLFAWKLETTSQHTLRRWAHDHDLGYVFGHSMSRSILYDLAFSRQKREPDRCASQIDRALSRVLNSVLNVKEYPSTRPGYSFLRQQRYSTKRPLIRLTISTKNLDSLKDQSNGCKPNRDPLKDAHRRSSPATRDYCQDPEPKLIAQLIYLTSKQDRLHC